MTGKPHNAIWVRGSDLERLFSAGRICYLVGGYDGSANYGDILQLHANIERLHTAGEDILAAPLVYWKYKDDHDALCDEHPWLFNDCCFLYYVPCDEVDDAESALNDRQLVTVPAPPPTFSQVVVYGGGFLNSWWGWADHKLDLIDLVTSWLGEGSPGSYPFAIIGQQISSNFLDSPHADQFATMLDHASMIGVRDELSLENLKQWNGSENVRNAVVSGDDATLPIITARDEQRKWLQKEHQVNRKSDDPPVVNIHLNTSKYVTDRAFKLQKAFEAIVRGLRQEIGDRLQLNLLIAYDDSRITETRVIDQLKASPALETCTVNVVSCIDELRQGFPNISRAELTISCSYHVALTSLFLGIPTAFVHANEYYWHKAEGLKRAFHLPDAMLFDVERDAADSFATELKRAVRDQPYRARLCEGAAQGSANMVLRSATTTTALTRFMTADYVASREERYRATAARLLDTTEQLSDLRLEYGRLLNNAMKLSATRWAKSRQDQRPAADYEATIRAIRTAVGELLPAGATVLVVSRGDDALLQLDGCTGWHFPQAPGGGYVGHHPANGTAAVEHLTNLRTSGAEYLVFPNTAFWWLDHYKELAQHLDQHHRKIWSDPHCIIFQLSKVNAKPVPTNPKAGQNQQPGAEGKTQLSRVTIQKHQPAATASGPNGAENVELAPNPIIVYGPPRSGTTYLMEILNRHPDVHISRETRLFVWAHRTLNRETHEFYSLFDHREQFIDHLREAYPALIRSFYRKLSPNTRFWGDKNPHYASPDSDGCLQTILELFPGARFINIIRDGRGTVASVLRKGWEDFETAHRWSTSYAEYGCAFGRTLPSEQYFELRYEDLIQDDTAVARRLFDFLEIEIHADVVKFCDAQRVKRSPINHPERDLNGDLTGSDWSSILTPEQQLQSLDLLGKQLVAHGYETTASLEQIQNELRHAATPRLAGSVRNAIRGALPVGSNGSGRRFGLTRRGTD